ncbi:MAG: SDR family oxidoreductase [Polyangiaceae bacterium]
MSQHAVITGVSRGIGRAVALQLAARGVTLSLLGRPSEGHEATVAACRARGVRVGSHACDLADPASVSAAARGLLAAEGTPTVVVNNAAILERGRRVQDIEPDEWDRVLAVNLRGPFLLTRALLPAMLGAGRGRFLHVSSISGTIGCPEMAHYGASKWGLLGFHAALSEELKGTGLLSVAILPGSVDTEMLEKTPFPPDMTPEEVAGLMVFYALDAPSAVAGARVEVYG